MRRATFALLAVFAAAPLAAQAAVSENVGDARCLMTMAALASMPEPTRQEIGRAGVIFFASRIKSREPGYDFTRGLKAAGATLGRENLQTEAQRCGPMVLQTLQQLQKAQQALGPATPAPPAPAAGATPPRKP
jgi:hypothetical protein